MSGICMHQVEARFGFGKLYLHASRLKQKERDVTEVGTQAAIQLDFLALFREVPQEE
jgi:hypothetical protein